MDFDYSSVTEIQGSEVTLEQLSRIYRRYNTAIQYAQNRRVLEVSCGTGIGLGYLARKARSVVGGDYTENLLKVAKSYYYTRIPLIRLDAHHLPFRNHSFDLVVLLEAIYYLGDPGQFLLEVRRVLDKNGILLISTVNKDWSEFAPSPFSTRYFSVPELRDLLRQKGFDKLEYYGAFPTKTISFSQKLVSLIRKLAVSLNLMPKTLKGRARLKRIFYGRLTPLPSEITDGMAKYIPPITIAHDSSNFEYKVIYAIARV